MSDPKTTAMYYLKLASQAQHLGYVKGLAARRSYDFPSSSHDTRRDSPFAVAGRIFREELQVNQQAERKTKLIKDLLSDRMKTARLLAAEAYPAQSRPGHRGKDRHSSLSQYSSDQIHLPLIGKQSGKPQQLRCSRMGRLNSIITVCAEENHGNDQFKQKLTTEKDANQQEFRSFKDTLELVESLGEHRPEILAQLYASRVKQDQEAQLDSYLLQRLARHVQ